MVTIILIEGLNLLLSSYVNDGFLAIIGKLQAQKSCSTVISMKTTSASSQMSLAMALWVVNTMTSIVANHN